MTPRAVLVGPPGSGKTTIGRLLAQRLDVDFADADAEIERAAGKPITDIFADDGEEAFRTLEEQTITAGLEAHNGVYSLGGGAVMSDRTRKALADHTVVFLNVGMAVGVQRTGLSSARPLLTGVNPRARFKTLLDARLPLYREVANLEVQTDHTNPDDIVADIVAQLEGTAS